MPTPDLPSPLTRRTALLGLLGAGALSGCSFEGMRVQVPGSATESPSPSASASPDVRAGDTEADERLLGRLVDELIPVLTLLTRTTSRHPALRGRLAPLSESLRTDLATLRAAGPGGATTTPSPTATATATAVPASQDAALRSSVAAATRLRDSLGRSALAALSGRFARLIASMAAALSQRLSRLSSTAASPTTRVPALPATSSSDVGGDSPLQDALAGEHAAVYVYSVLGAQTSQSAQPEAYDDLTAAYTWHRGCRDRLVATLRERGLAPAPAAASYALPNAVATPAQVTAAALVTEQRVTTLYGRLVQETVAGDRAWAVALLRESALRQLGFGGSAETFPGTTD
ncbi:ferritin-like domain-containing protein [Marmoricola endophyticus]|uniref:ferritin-like domain-containing protein n=1 Tax=Marmoricola endophyticus TaxID=2040280 RepID=UPI001667F35F|nr:ferritin-like domain-containing protein [Marmoricola endophyticus]